MAKAIAILLAIAAGAAVPALAQLVPALPWVIGLLLFVAFCGMPRGATTPGRVHLAIAATAWLIGGAACAALWRIDRDLAIGALLAGAAPTATAAPTVMAALRGDAAFAAIAVLGSNLAACLAFPAVLAVLQGPEAPGSPLQLLARVAPVVLAPLLAARVLVRKRPAAAAAVARIMPATFWLWLAGLTVISASAVAHLREAGPHAALPPLAVALALCVASFAIGARLGRPHRSREASQCLGQKNTALATWTALSCAGPPAALVPVAYILCHNLWNAVSLARMQRAGADRGAD
jgi:BASS family bile acid:Na+ symporter